MVSTGLKLPSPRSTTVAPSLPARLTSAGSTKLPVYVPSATTTQSCGDARASASSSASEAIRMWLQTSCDGGVTCERRLPQPRAITATALPRPRTLRINGATPERTPECRRKPRVAYGGSGVGHDGSMYQSACERMRVHSSVQTFIAHAWLKVFAEGCGHAGGSAQQVPSGSAMLHSLIENCCRLHSAGAAHRMLLMPPHSTVAMHAPSNAMDAPAAAATSAFQYVTRSQPHCGSRALETAPSSFGVQVPDWQPGALQYSSGAHGDASAKPASGTVMEHARGRPDVPASDAVPPSMSVPASGAKPASAAAPASVPPSPPEPPA